MESKPIPMLEYLSSVFVIVVARVESLSPPLRPRMFEAASQVRGYLSLSCRKRFMHKPSRRFLMR